MHEQFQLSFTLSLATTLPRCARLALLLMRVAAQMPRFATLMMPPPAPPFSCHYFLSFSAAFDMLYFDAAEALITRRCAMILLRHFIAHFFADCHNIDIFSHYAFSFRFAITPLIRAFRLIISMPFRHCLLSPSLRLREPAQRCQRQLSSSDAAISAALWRFRLQPPP